jgi:hypothetical protein
MTKKYWMFAAVPMLCAACAGTQAERVTDNQMKRIDQQAQTQLDSVDKHADRRQAKVDEDYKSQKAKVSESDMPNAEQSENMLDYAKERKDYHVQTRAELDKLAVRIKAAGEKIRVLGPNATDPLRQELVNVSTEQSTLLEQLTDMSEAAPSDWDAGKSKMDDRISGLDSRIDDLSSEIDDASKS